MTHEQASELLAAYSLDAVDGDENTTLESIGDMPALSVRARRLA